MIFIIATIQISDIIALQHNYHNMTIFGFSRRVAHRLLYQRRNPYASPMGGLSGF